MATIKIVARTGASKRKVTQVKSMGFEPANNYQMKEACWADALCA